MCSNVDNTDFHLNEESSCVNATGKCDNSNATYQWDEFCDESILKMLDEPFELMVNGSCLRTEEKYYGFDNNVGDSWIYPTNFPIRNYQFSIVRAALFKNTLVVLPTGLGKTFIAAVIMYNIYRWYPTGKVVFMAPTRPLVNQQIEACRKIMGMPVSDIAEMTGKQNKKARHDLWRSKRIFFATPQVVQSDINDSEQDFPFGDIKLLVIDEAHKAKGRYAYTEVVQSLTARNPYFRVLALSATPGRRIEDVIEIVQNLFISHIELRWENSVDVIPYTHKKNVKTIVVPLGDELTKVKNEFIDIIDPYIRNLMDNGVLSGSVHNISRGWLIMEQKRFKEMSIRLKHPNHSSVSTDFSICISLYHALELLERHGVRVFLNFFEDSSENSLGMKNDKFFVAMNPKLKKFIDDLRQKTGPNPFLVSDQTMTNGQIAKIPENLDFGHPKFDMVKKFLMEHFEKEDSSRAIIFCEYRESVLLIHRLLLQCRPLIRPRIFVGQGGVGSIRAVTQKQQIQIMSDFRNGISNTLIATSVAEEGIDVGDVDLIICFDISTKNPTRFVQRIGRTGRKRQGHVIMLVTEGKEHAIVKEVLATKDKTNQKIAKSKEIKQILYKTSPRLVPPEFDPKCVQTFIKIQNDEIKNNNDGNKKKNERKKKPIDLYSHDDFESGKIKKSRGRPSKKLLQQQSNQSPDVRNFFKKIELDDEEKDVFNVLPQCEKPKNKSTLIGNIDTFITDVDINECNKENNYERRNQYQSAIRKLNNFSRRLDNPFDYEIIETPSEAIKTKKLSKLGKRFYLEKNFIYVKEKYEAIKALEAIKIDDDEITDEISNLKEEFSLIEDIFGGRSEIVEFLKSCNEDIHDKELKQMNEKFSSIFDGLERRDVFDNVEDFLVEKLKEIDSKRETDCIKLMEKSKTESVVYDDHHAFHNSNKYASEEEFNENDFDFVDSKYISQWTQFKGNEIKMQSTPLRNDVEKKGFFMKHKNHDEMSSNVNNSNYNENFDEKIEDNLLDDDFNEILATSLNALFEIENQANISAKENENKSDKSANSVNNVHMIAEKENIPKNYSKKVHISNPEIEDFDLNEFFEPFDEEKDDEKYFSENSSSKNLFDGTKSVANSKIEDVSEIKKRLSTIIDQNRNVQKYESDNIEMNEIDEDQNEKQQLSTKPLNRSISPKKLLTMSTDTSPSVFKRRVNLSKLKQFHSESAVVSDDDSVFNNKNASSFESNHLKSFANNLIDESVIRQPMLKRNKRLLESSETSLGSEDEILENSQKHRRKRFRSCRKFKRRKCSFFDDEAQCSENEINNVDSDDTHSRYVLDSVIVDDFEELPLTINTKAKYLQSIRSPRKGSAAFKIPSLHTYPSLSQICSQPIVEEDFNTYKEDSFVVTDDENVNEREINETCPLERAEAILKARRKAKKRGLRENKRTKIISKFTDSSEEDK